VGKFTAGVAEINEKTMIVGIVFCLQSFVYFANHFITTLAIPSTYPSIWWDISLFLSQAIEVMNLVALFIMAVWGVDKRRFLFAASAILSILLSQRTVYVLELLIGNTITQLVMSILLGMVPYILLIGDAITRKEPKILAIFLVAPVALEVIDLVYLAIGLDAFVLPLAVQSVLQSVGIQAYFINFSIRGFYYLVVTARGKQWLDKKRAALVFVIFGAFHVVLSAIRVLASFYIYDGGQLLAYSLVLLIMGGFALYTGIKTWTLRNRTLEKNVLFHVL
jgi:hypothetical protein